MIASLVHSVLILSIDNINIATEDQHFELFDLQKSLSNLPILQNNPPQNRVYASLKLEYINIVACDPHQLYLKKMVHMYLKRDSSTFIRRTKIYIFEKAEIWRKHFLDTESISV